MIIFCKSRLEPEISEEQIWWYTILHEAHQQIITSHAM